MKHYSQILLLFVCLAGCAISCTQQSTVYYIDSLNGNDAHSGRHPDRAWKTLGRISAAAFKPGDSILLKSGLTFDGTLMLTGITGASNSPVVISSWGTGKAIINSGDSAAIILRNSSFINCNNLRVYGSGRLSGNKSDGIQFINTLNSSIDSIDASGYLFSGVHILGGKSIRITRVNAHDNGFSGIFTESGEKEYGDDGSKYKTLKNVYIGYCTARNNPGCPVMTENHSGNGILMAGVVYGIIEYCEAMENGWDMPREGNGPVGIWAYMSDSILIRNCYSHHNKTSPGGKDGGGFDFDGGIRFSVMENNLSAYNEGAGYGIFQYAGATEWTGNIIRRNISYNDGSKNSQAGIFMWCDPAASPMKNFSAVYNTVITSFDHAVAFEPGHYQGFHFARNIFQTGKGKEFITGKYSGAFFDTNLYWSDDAPKMISEDPNAIIENPRLYLPSENEPLNEIEKTAWFKASDSLLTFGARVARH